MLKYNKLLFCIFIIIHTQIFYRINEFLSRDGALNFFFYYFSQNICDPSRYPKQNMNYFLFLAYARPSCEHFKIISSCSLVRRWLSWRELGMWWPGRISTHNH